VDNEDEGARLTRREENRELIAKHRAEVEMLAESIVERGAVDTPVTDAVVKMMEAGWLSLGSSAPGAVRPLIEMLEAFERELIDLKQRLLPQYLGRAERAENAKRMAEHDRDSLLEQLLVAEKRVADQMTNGVATGVATWAQAWNVGASVEGAKMSNTPRTDAATVRMERLDGDADVVVAAFFARQLERELIATRSATGAILAKIDEYGFECEAGFLTNCAEWRELKEQSK